MHNQIWCDADSGKLNCKFHNFCHSGAWPKWSKSDNFPKIVFPSSAHLKKKLNLKLCRPRFSQLKFKTS